MGAEPGKIRRWPYSCCTAPCKTGSSSIFTWPAILHANCRRSCRLCWMPCALGSISWSSSTEYRPAPPSMNRCAWPGAVAAPRQQLANAVLRQVAANRDHLPLVDQADFAAYLSTRYSHPLWFAQRMLKILGPEGAERLFAADNQVPPVTVRVNTLRTDPAALGQALEGEGVRSTPHPWLPDCLVMETGGNLTETQAFQKGLFYIQDPASQLPPWALAVQPGEDVLDLCAAPGGKTMIAAQMQRGQGKLLAMDIHGFKCEELLQTSRRYGIENLEVRAADSAVFQPGLEGAFHKVICDVPCSGMGILRKKADIRFKQAGDVEGLPGLQKRILSCASTYCKPGGTVVYSTCTVLPEENEQVVQAFLAENPAFSLAPLVLPGLGEEPRGWRTLYPHTDGTDGFFLACLRRNQESL